MNALERAALAAAIDGGAPPKTFEVGPEAEIEIGSGPSHPFDGVQVTHWSVD